MERCEISNVDCAMFSSRKPDKLEEFDSSLIRDCERINMILTSYQITETDLSPLALSVWQCDVVRFGTLISTTSSALFAVDTHQRTLLHLAADRGCVDLVELLVASDLDVNALDSDANTPLIKAVQADNKECCRVLLKHGAYVDMRNFSGYSALHLACLRKSTCEICALLLDFDADVNLETKNRDCGLHICCCVDNTDLAACLLQRGADINAAGHNSNTALHYTAYCAGCDMAKLILSYHPNINALNIYNQTPLDIAVKCKNTIAERVIREFLPHHQPVHKQVDEYTYSNVVGADEADSSLESGSLVSDTGCYENKHPSCYIAGFTDISSRDDVKLCSDESPSQMTSNPYSTFPSKNNIRRSTSDNFTHTKLLSNTLTLARPTRSFSSSNFRADTQCLLSHKTSSHRHYQLMCGCQHVCHNTGVHAADTDHSTSRHARWLDKCRRLFRLSRLSPSGLRFRGSGLADISHGGQSAHRLCSAPVCAARCARTALLSTSTQELCDVNASTLSLASEHVPVCSTVCDCHSCTCADTLVCIPESSEYYGNNLSVDDTRLNKSVSLLSFNKRSSRTSSLHSFNTMSEKLKTRSLTSSKQLRMEQESNKYRINKLEKIMREDKTCIQNLREQNEQLQNKLSELTLLVQDAETNFKEEQLKNTIYQKQRAFATDVLKRELLQFTRATNVSLEQLKANMHLYNLSRSEAKPLADPLTTNTPLSQPSSKQSPPLSGFRGLCNDISTQTHRGRLSSSLSSNTVAMLDRSCVKRLHGLVLELCNALFDYSACECMFVPVDELKRILEEFLRCYNRFDCGKCSATKQDIYSCLDNQYSERSTHLTEFNVVESGNRNEFKSNDNKDRRSWNSETLNPFLQDDLNGSSLKPIVSQPASGELDPLTSHCGAASVDRLLITPPDSINVPSVSLYQVPEIADQADDDLAACSQRCEVACFDSAQHILSDCPSAPCAVINTSPAVKTDSHRFVRVTIPSQMQCVVRSSSLSDVSQLSPNGLGPCLAKLSLCDVTALHSGHSSVSAGPYSASSSEQCAAVDNLLSQADTNTIGQHSHTHSAQPRSVSNFDNYLNANILTGNDARLAVRTDHGVTSVLSTSNWDISWHHSANAKHALVPTSAYGGNPLISTSSHDCSRLGKRTGRYQPIATMADISADCHQFLLDRTHVFDRKRALSDGYPTTLNGDYYNVQDSIKDNSNDFNSSLLFQMDRSLHLFEENIRNYLPDRQTHL